MTKIFLDSCVIIYLIEKHPTYASRVAAMMKGVKDGVFCFSPFVRLECLVMPLRNKDAALEKLYASFFKSQRSLNISSAVYNQAARLRADFLIVENARRDSSGNCRILQLRRILD